MIMFGVDEAGKGPVIGPMVIASVKGEEKCLPENIDDSKNLSPEKREKLSKTIKETFEVSVEYVLPEEIDNDESNLSELTVKAQSNAIDKLTNPTDGFVDACDTDEERFKINIVENTESEVQITSEHGADETYPIVSAASIIAKVERDSIIENLNSNFEQNIGSGYPSDPNTRKFLTEYYKENEEFPGCVRKSWKTVSDIRKNNS